MKEMPTAILPADSEYVYEPDSDTWIVQKKSGHKKLSKKHQEEAICPSCGDWKPTDFTPEELKEKEWECMDCMNKRLTNPADLPENRGQKQITRFDPEFEWLLKLVDVVTKAGVPASEIKALAQSHPFKTIDDAGDLAVQIWTLAIEKYGIPRDWLIKKLPERKASLKKAYEGGYPTEEDSVQFGMAPQGNTAYEPWKRDSQTGLREGDTRKPIVICPTCKSDKIAKEGEQAKCQACGTNFIPKPDRGSDDLTVNDYSQNYFWGPNDLGRSHQNQPGANGWLPAGTEDMDGPSPNVRMSSFSKFMLKTSSLYKIAHCGPCSVIKAEVIKMLADMKYKDASIHAEDLKELALYSADPSNLSFIQYLGEVIEALPEDHEKEAQKLKNHKLALEDIQNRIDDKEMVVDKQENVEKEADFKEYSNQLTKDVNDWIVAHPMAMAEVISQSKKLPSVEELSEWFYKLLSGVAESLIHDPNRKYDDKQVYWNELAHVWDTSVKGGEDEQRRFNKQEPLVNVDIENLPTLDKHKKLDELLEQLSAETDPQKKEQIKQRIERIKNASLKAAQEEYPKISKPKSGYVDNGIGYTCGRCEYFNPEREKCKKVEGTIKSFGCCNFWDGEGKFKEKNKTAEKALETDKRALTKEEAVYVEYPNVDYRCDECAFFNAEAKTCTKVDDEISPTASCNFWQPIKSKQANLNKQALEVVPRNPNPLIELEVKFNEQEVPFLDEIASQMQEARKRAHASDLPFDIESVYKPTGENRLWIDVYAPSVEEAIDKINSFFQTAFGQRKQISSLQNVSLRKQANPPSRFWIAPDGKEFDARTHHGAWIDHNKQILKQYGIDTSGNLHEIAGRMYAQGWTRVSNEPVGKGFQIQVNDPKHLPAYLDDFIAKNFSEGNEIIISNMAEMAKVTNPFPNIQKAVNRALEPIATWASVKQASVLDEVLDQTTQDAIAAEYGPQMLIAMRFYNDAVRYGQSPDRAMAYALEESKRMRRPIEQRQFLEVLDTYFQ